MPQRLKTVQYAFPTIASVTNNTLTNFTQITVHLPETGTKTIRSAWVDITMDDIITATGGSVTTSTIDLRLGAGAYDTTFNNVTKPNTGDNISWQFTRDFSFYFASNWSGTSMTCDVRLQINQSTGTTLNMVNVTCVLNVTYEYDDASTTQLKTVLIPLNAPVTFLPTTKTSHDTVPALDTYLPETSKTYRNIFIVTKANTHASAATDHTVNYELSSLGVTTTGNYESALITDRLTTYVWNITSYITTNTTHTFNVWSSLTARHHGMQAYMVVTYEYNSSTTTSVMNSVQIPVDVGSGFNRNISEFFRTETEFWVQEPSPVRQRFAFYAFWQNNASESNAINTRLGTGSFITYTFGGVGEVAGNKTLMVRNDSPTGVSFQRGKNTFIFDFYINSSTLVCGGLGGFYLLNYTSNIALGGAGVHNKTVIFPMQTQGTVSNTNSYISSPTLPALPDTNYFFSHIGGQYSYMQSAASQGISIKVERLSSEGSNYPLTIHETATYHDAEMGVYHLYYDSNMKKVYRRWKNDLTNNRIEHSGSRRHYIFTTGTGSWILMLGLFLTYHSITSTISGNITNSNGGTVNIALCRVDSNNNPTEILLTTSRTGNGSYSFTWYDNTENLAVFAYENSTYKGRSATGTATLDA